MTGGSDADCVVRGELVSHLRRSLFFRCCTPRFRVG
jgi:hypothetical protein